MQHMQILLFFIAVLFFNPAWAMYYKPACKLLPCPTHPLCLVDVPGFLSEQWDIKASKGECGLGRDIECCMCAYYQELKLTKDEFTPALEGASGIPCGLCLFVMLSLDENKQMTVHEGDKQETHYEQCQILWCCGCTEGSFDDRTSCACHLFGNGLVWVENDIIQTIDCLCCFTSCNPDPGKPPVAYEMSI